ncbi:MAG: hypothetical protein RLZ87_897 [Armatimonadota bacterium]
MKFFRFLAFITFFALILGCGGGGGASGIKGIRYITDWANKNAPGQITGESQRISIIDSSGLTVSTVVLQNPEKGTESNDFMVSDGDYTLSVELFSLSGASGTVTGVFKYPFAVRGGIGGSVQTEVAKSISSISVAPGSASVKVGRGANFFAYGSTSSGNGTFIEPTGLQWNALGAIGTVTKDGFFAATAPGTGSVQAVYNPNARSGSAVVNVQSSVATKSKWTVLVYMNGANDLQAFSVLNMNQMERVASNPEVRFVVQWKQFPAAFAGGTFNGTRRYLAKQDTTSNIASELLQDMGTTVDMGSTQTLREFIQWGKANYPADRYCLIVWNHGNGWKRSRGFDTSRAVSYDDEKGTSIQIWDLNQALGTEQFDIIAWDASLMQMFEVAYEVKDNTKFVVGSEESPPGEGYPYDTVFGTLKDNPDQTTKNFTKSFVDGMLGVPSYATRKITQSVLDTSQLSAYAIAISNLGIALKNNQPAINSAITTARNTSQGYSVTATRIYLDLIDVCKKLEVNTTEPSVLSAITNLKAAHANALVWEGHNSKSPNSNGVSIDFSPGSIIAPTLSDYQKLKFAQATQWDEFLTTAP